MTIVSAQPPGLGEFGGGALGLAVKAVGGSEPGTDGWYFRTGTARFFEPQDCLVRARLQQMHEPNLPIPNAEQRIAWAEPDGALDQRDRLLDRAAIELALAESM